MISFFPFYDIHFSCLFNSNTKTATNDVLLQLDLILKIPKLQKTMVSFLSFLKDSNWFKKIELIKFEM